MSAANNNAVKDVRAFSRRAASLAIAALALASCAATPAPQTPNRGAEQSGGFFESLWRGTLGAEPRLPRPPPPPPGRPPPRARAATPPPATAPEGPTAGTPEFYRVAADGTVGCADPAAPARLDRLRKAGEAAPRALAQAHREGGCMTVFRVSRWRLEEDSEEAVRLRLQDPPGGRPVVLHFLRRDIEAQP